MHNRFCAHSSGGWSDGAKGNRLYVLGAYIFGRIDACGAEGPATRVPVTDFSVKHEVSALFQGIRSPGRFMLGMVPPLRFGLLFARRRRLGVGFPLLLELRIPRRH